MTQNAENVIFFSDFRDTLFSKAKLYLSFRWTRILFSILRGSTLTDSPESLEPLPLLELLPKRQQLPCGVNIVVEQLGQNGARRERRTTGRGLADFA